MIIVVVCQAKGNATGCTLLKPLLQKGVTFFCFIVFTVIAIAFFVPTITTSFFPLVTPEQKQLSLQQDVVLGSARLSEGIGVMRSYVLGL
jgi:hypothetical protein